MSATTEHLPTGPTIVLCLSFLVFVSTRHSPLGSEEIRRWLAPYSLAEVSRTYRDLLRRTEARMAQTR